MTKCFLDDEIDQSLMMPPSLHDWLPEDHLARFVADLVPSLDLSEFYASYEEKDGRGQAAYHPVMMVRLLIYGYCIGVVSSRQIEKRTYEDVAFRYLSADEHPDHTTINEFRKRHLKALAGLLLQGLQLCQSAGLVKMGHVALDGTKKQANASKHKAMSYGRMGEAEEKLKAQIQELLERAEAVDAAEDEKEGLHVAAGREKHGTSEESAPSADPAKAVATLEEMKQKLQSDAGRAIYKMRKAIVEPVFGQIKECRHFRRFSFRGLENVKAEWKLVCLAHNILKLFRSGRGFQAVAA